MAKYTVNDAAVARCRELIDARQYVLDSDWGDVQPNAETAELVSGWSFLGRVRRLAPRPHRRAPPIRPRPAMGSSSAISAGCTGPALIACVYRAAEWRHKTVERAAYDLLQHLDETSG